MAEFCSLCGYNELDITQTYNKHLKPIILENFKTMSDDSFLSIGLGGICEHCGIVRFGINKKFEAWGSYYEEPDHKFGYVDKETLELIILEDDPKYNKQRKGMNGEEQYVRFENALYGLYCLKNNKDISELTSEDFDAISKIYTETINKCSIK